MPGCEFEPASREFDPRWQNHRPPPHREFRLHRLGRHRDKVAKRATGQHHPRRYLRPSGGPRALDVCYWPDFTQLVHDLCNKIAEVRQAA